MSVEDPTKDHLADVLETLADDPMIFMKSIRLVIEARLLIQQLMERPGVGSDVLRAYTRKADEFFREIGVS
jgi:hypothetical protein